MKPYLISMMLIFLLLFGYHSFILNLKLIHALVVSVLYTAVLNILCGAIYVIIVLCSACFEKEVEQIVEMTERPDGPEIVVIQNPNHISLGIACEPH